MLKQTNLNVNRTDGTGMHVTPKSLSFSRSNKENNNLDKEDETLSHTDLNIRQFEERSNDFDAILFSLDNKLNPSKESMPPKQLLKRLSNKFVHSPKNFTEKLLSIIEESVIDYEETYSTTSIDLSRLTTEFRKMCKFIEDESMPDWPPSPTTITDTHMEKEESLLCSEVTYCDANSDNSQNTSSSLLHRDGFLRMRFLDVDKTIRQESSDLSLSRCDNMSFEFLEAQCEKLYPKEYEQDAKAKSSSLPGLIGMDDIHAICDRQLASLDTSTSKQDFSDDASVPTALTLRALEKYQTSREKSSPQQSNQFTYTKVTQRKKGSLKSCLKPNNKQRKGVDLSDELEKTLLSEVAEKRQRCLDTAKIMMEVDAGLELNVAPKSFNMLANLAMQKDIDTCDNNDKLFLNTLMSCKKYHSYLEKHKPFFDLSERTDSFTCNNSGTESGKARETKDILKTLKRDTESLSTPSKTLLRVTENKQPNGKEYVEERKPKYFVSPGKYTGIGKRFKTKRTYFTNVDILPKNPAGQNIMRRPHVEGLYRLNYNSVISPVGRYIRGADTHVMKNVRSKMIHDSAPRTPAKNEMKLLSNLNKTPVHSKVSPN